MWALEWVKVMAAPLFHLFPAKSIYSLKLEKTNWKKKDSYPNLKNKEQNRIVKRKFKI